MVINYITILICRLHKIFDTTSLGTINNREVLYTLFAGTPFESNVQLSMLGLPVILPRSGYYASIIPIIASVWFGSKLEKWFSQRLPKILRSFLTPFFTVLIAFPIALLIIGPIANFLSAIIGEFFVGIYDISPILFGTLLAAIWQILVIFGLHWGIIPIQFLLLAEQGFEPVSATTMMSTFGILGVLLALIIKSKEDKVKQIAIPASFSALFGISEPAVYGLMLPLRRSFIYAIIANAIAGAYIGYTNTVSYRTGGLGIFSMFRGIDPDGTLGANFWNFLIGFAIATLVAFVLQMLFPVERLDKATEAVADDVIVNDTNDVTPVPVVAEDEEIIASPLSGELMPLSETPDAVFSSGALGKGITIKPSEGLVKAPANGKVTALFDTGHAIGITTDLGTEILIHIGIDTVEMNGQGFTKLVENGDTVQAGQVLIQFDIATIEAAGKSSVVPVIVTKSGDYTDVIFTTDDIIKAGDYLFTSVK
ncbi:glucose PTS transporter subunit IIA [Fundicoccus sp. Sow4_H7]|uniref:glucose PTS transporter subunit IIA n=1 Tax=Fundicoccus sp. Sow4_H7 TaxID=3438784 RepID=UPI003F8EF04F